METVVVDHPIVRSRLTVMRDERSSNAEFRAALRELATLLVYEATRNLASTDVRVTTPIGPATGELPAASFTGSVGRFTVYCPLIAGRADPPGAAKLCEAIALWRGGRFRRCARSAVGVADRVRR